MFYSATAQTVPASQTYSTVNKGTTGITTGSTITSSSTAEECVRFIDKKVRTAVGQSINKHYTITNAYFTGGKYIYQEIFSSSIRDKYSSVSQTTFSNINWACYKSVILKDIDAVSMKATLFFDASCPLSYQFQIFDYETSATKVTGKEYQYDSLVLFFGKSEKTGLADLDKAAKRLSQIIKEKGNIFKTETFKPKVIAGKPSFRETVEYIQDNYTKEILSYASTKDNYGNGESAELKNWDITVSLIANTDSLHISWYQTLRIPVSAYDKEQNYYRDYSYVFSVKDIESVSAEYWNALNGFVTYKDARGEGTFPYGIGFKAAKGKTLIRQYYKDHEGVKRVGYVTGFTVPYSNYSTKDNPDNVINTFKNTQIFKAFNHLRNLCGAPEPMKFD